MTSRTGTIHARLAATLLLLMSAGLLVGCDGKGKRQMASLRQFAAETPRYQDFVEKSSFEQYDADSALLSFCYESSAKVDDVVAFYSRSMADRNWVLFPKEARGRTIFYAADLAFRKGDYLFGITRDEQGDNRCRYLISYYWTGF